MAADGAAYHQQWSNLWQVCLLFVQMAEFFVIRSFGQPLISLFLFSTPCSWICTCVCRHPSMLAEDQAIAIQCSWGSPPWNVLHHLSTLSCCKFVLTSPFFRHLNIVVNAPQYELPVKVYSGLTMPGCPLSGLRRL